MNSANIFRKGMVMMLIGQMIFSLVAPAVASAQEGTQSPASFQTIDTNQLSVSSNDNVLLAPANTTLSLNILSSPWVVLDHNDPNGAGGEVPKVFVVEAEVTNSGAETATNVVVSLSYNNPANNWVLLPGENPVRTIDALAPGESYYAYWFARYSTVIGANFQYSVSASADNASLVTTSDNFYGNPAPNKTVQTRSYISTGNSGVFQTSADVIVGVAFTVTVNYDLGNNPVGVLFSPVGNIDFDADAYRLLATQVRFYNDAGTQSTTVNDRLYFNVLPVFAENAEVSYTFIALTPGTTRLCPYGAVDFNSNDKYDNFYCQDTLSTSITIDGSISVEMTKQASSSTIQQGQTLDYTIHYTNTGTASLQFVWIWDDVDTSLASIDTGSISPAPDPGETTSSRIAWNIGNIAPAGQPGDSGTLSFSVVVDGNGADILDNTDLVNDAFFGIDPGSLPGASALSSTTTTLIQAPTLLLSKTDGKTFAEPGDLSTYTLSVTNTGSLAATNVVITDVLPANLTLAGAPVPPPNITNGQTLVWNTLGPIAASGGNVTIDVPVTVDIMTPNGTVLNNPMTVQYENPSGYRLDNKTENDTTTVNAPVLSISKSDSPDPVLTGNELVYTLHYANTGPASATNVVITDTVPMSTTYQSCSGGSTCNENSGVVTWDLGTVPASSSGDVFLTVLVADFLATGTFITNDDYGVNSDQSGFIAGATETTLVNRDAAIIQGHAFEDTDGDGVKDPGETTGFANLTVSLFSTSLPVTTTTTDSSGFYKFRLEVGLPISITAEIPTNNFRTTPGEFYLQATLGITQTVNFGYAADTSPFGVVFGTVFEDKNHNGSQNLGEAGLSGVEVAGTSAASSPVATDEFGHYTLRFDSNTNTTVTETNPAGYVSTTPDDVQMSVVTGSSNGSPVDFGDFQGIKITGQVFEDLNVDATKDAGEGGLSGASVVANSANILTDSTGFYTMYLSLSGSSPILITETDPAGYVSTNAIPGNGMTRVSANSLQIGTPISGTVYANAYFGDALSSNVVTIAGQVWNDNGAGGGGLANGQLDGTEPGLAGALVQLSSGMSQTTAVDGNFLLYAPPGQSITLTETTPGGYVSTNAIPGNDASKLDHDTLLVSSLSGGSTSSGNLFGDVLTSSAAVISGRVFDDANENGQLDGGELGILGVQVTLEDSTGNTVSVLTDSNGAYQFAAAPGAMIRILSAGPGGAYYPTTPESLYLVPPAAGAYSGNNFGYSNDGDVAVIMGVVFNDANGDGVRDFGELGLAGAGITLDGGSPVTTSGNGLFTYAVPQADIYALHETNPPGYRSSTPDDLNVVVSSLGTSHYVEFGDTNSVTTGTVYGTVFDDQNGNGLQEVDEPGLPGVVISTTVTSGVLTATTQSYGQYTFGFEVDTPVPYTIQEQDPALPGYRSTTPDEVVVLVAPNESTIVNFGDTTNSTFSSIMGTVFDDDNGDGNQDPSELGLTGVLVSLSNGMTANTDANGNYTFPVTQTGFLDVQETDPLGYHSTTPNEVTVHVASLGESFIVNFGDSDNPLLASIFGIVFDDLNANGQKDLAEPGLSGVSVDISGVFVQLLSSASGREPAVSFVTNEWGQYTFQIENTGIFTITETDLSGYLSTNAIPGSLAVTKLDNNNLRANVTTLGRDFGDNQFADAMISNVITVTGMVWNDNGAGGGTAGDGVQDPGEPGLPGVPVSLSNGSSQVTEPDGSFLLFGLANQVNTLTETNLPGYISTNAIPGNDAIKIDDDTLAINALSGGSESAGNLFGDVRDENVALIFGTVFEDSDGDGVMDPGETGLPNVTLTLDGSSSTLTNSNGQYFFATDVEGIHSIVETDPDGYFSTTPNEVHVSVAAGLSYQADFGDAPDGSGFASIYGTVFEDLDLDSQWDPDEGSIQGVTVSLDGAATALTNQYGAYTFSTTDEGTHTVVETDLPGYLSTTPNIINVDVTLNNGYQVDFGDASELTCEPDTFEEDDTRAQANAIVVGDPAQVHNFCDDATDWVSFTAQAGAVYTITTSAWGQRADTFLSLYDTDGTTLLAANDDYEGTTDFSSQLVWQATADGVYYVRTTNRSNLTQALTGYDIWVEGAEKTGFTLYLPIVVRSQPTGAAILPKMVNNPDTPSGEINHFCPDTYEVDDTWQEAGPIVPGEVQTHSFDSNPVLYAADKDYVWVDLEPGDTVTFTVSQASNTQTYLELFDENGLAMDVTGETELVWTASDAGRYYLSVSPLDSVNFGCVNTVSYDLSVEIETPTSNTLYLPIVVR